MEHSGKLTKSVVVGVSGEYGSLVECGQGLAVGVSREYGNILEC